MAWSRGDPVLELVLECQSGLFLRGRVVDPGGRGAGARVQAAQGALSLAVDSDLQGRFVLGPLPEGEWVLSARSSTQPEEVGA